MATATLTGDAPAHFSRFDAAFRLRVFALAGLWLVWEFLGASGLVYPGVLPSWFRIVPALAGLVAAPDFWFHLAVTGTEVGLAFLLGSTFGIAVGLSLGVDRWIGPPLERYLTYLASTPKVVFLPLFFILFGIGISSKIMIGAFACSFPVALGTADAMRRIPAVFVRVGRSFGLTGWQLARMIYLPALTGPVLTSMQIGLGIACSACLIAEMRVANKGLGSLLAVSYDRARFPEVYAFLIIIVGFAVGGNALLTRLATRRRSGS